MLEMLSSFPIWGWITAGALLIGLLATFAYRRRTSHAPPARLDFAFDPPEQKIEEEEMVAVSSLEAQYRQRSDALKEREREIGVRRQALRDRQHESSGLETLLAAATGQERANLAAILEMVEDASPAALAEGLGKAGSHVLGELARRGRGVPYDQVVRDVSAKLKLPRLEDSAPTCERERQILTAAFERMLAEASPQQREAILTELSSRQGSAVGLGAGTAALVVANMSGFALYTAASSALAAVTGAVGVTLPFATYMGLSSVIATVTGPVGWAALGVWAVASLGGTNFKKTIPAVMLVGTIRMRLIAERDQELQALAHEQNDLGQKWTQLRKLRGFLDRLGPVPEGYRVRARAVPQ